MTDLQTVVANPVPLTGSERVARSRRRKREDIVLSASRFCRPSATRLSALAF